MNTQQIRDGSIQAAKSLGVIISSELPLLDASLKIRRTGEVVSRILTMNVVAAAAYGFDRSKAIAWLTEEGLIDSLSKAEKQLIFNGVGQPDRFKVQVGGIWALGWAMNIVNELNFGKDCDNRFVSMLPNLKQGQRSTDFREKVEPRLPEEIIAACDMAYCLHWAIRQADITGKQSPGNLKPYIVVERRRALEWLLHEDAWDDVSLDT